MSNSSCLSVTFSSQHLLHPFSLAPSRKNQLVWQGKALAITLFAVGIILAVTLHPLAIVPGICAAYLYCGWVKARALQKIQSKEMQKAAGAAAALNVRPPAENVRQKITFTEQRDSFIHVTEKKRYDVRDETIRNRDAVLAKHEFGGYKSYLEQVKTYPDATVVDPSASRFLLGRFEVLQVPCIADYDENWDYVDYDQEPFYVHHGAALNIGESERAQDFGDYSTGRSLNENKYLDDMERIIHNMLKAQQASGATEAVWFPFGMGAFMRRLPKNDPSFKDPAKMADLKDKLAQRFVRQFQAFGAMTVHLCLPDDPKDNYNAFIKALEEVAPSNVKVYINVDALAKAQQLSNQKETPYKVSLANGANRNRIGNHWDKDRALVAIDENIHRRSVVLALIAHLINTGTGALSDRVYSLQC